MSISPDAFRNISLLTVGLLSVIGGLAGFLGYRFVELKTTLEHTRELLVAEREEVETLQQQLSDSEEALRQEKAKMDAFARQISDITGAVGILQRLQGTDRELLQKYSRTYFLSENYTPEEIAQINDEYVYNQERAQWIHVLVKPYLEHMIQGASSAGIELKVVSGYRSFREQSLVSGRHQVVYGQGANEFSAEQGYSEHQLGTTVDFTTSEIDVAFEDFEKTKAYQWLSQNAYQYGFVLSYPEGNPYYIFEPWHWRYVGVKLATDLHEQGRDFYDLDQEEINQYLLYIFD